MGMWKTLKWRQNKFKSRFKIKESEAKIIKGIVEAKIVSNGKLRLVGLIYLFCKRGT